MEIIKNTISQDEKYNEAWPDITLTDSGILICVYSQCTEHSDRSFTQIMLSESKDRGQTWSPKHPLTESTENRPYYYNTPRIQKMKNGRLIVTVDRVYGEHGTHSEARIVLYTSDDDGVVWDNGYETPASGIVPDKICELNNGRWLLSCHHKDSDSQKLVQRLWYSDNEGIDWTGPIIVAKNQELNMCEATLLTVKNKVVALIRENSGKGLGCFKTISNDGGKSWSEAKEFPLAGCHRPVSGYLKNGYVMVTYRFFPGGRWGVFHNLQGAVMEAECLLSQGKKEEKVRIFQIDHDNSPRPDTGYSGWVQFDDETIYAVNYIVDYRMKSFIRGYSFKMPESWFPTVKNIDKNAIKKRKKLKSHLVYDTV
ncbi:MAG: exo-alpha-sialidase [Bacteroidetes bacterium]|nr:exo-alpha-sialidase [Bacteroidota bacterium]